MLNIVTVIEITVEADILPRSLTTCYISYTSRPSSAYMCDLTEAALSPGSADGLPWLSGCCRMLSCDSMSVAPSDEEPMYFAFSLTLLLWLRLCWLCSSSMSDRCCAPVRDE